MPIPESIRLFVVVLALSLVGCGGTGETGTPDAGPVDGYESQTAQIFVDGEGADWSEIPVRHTDTGDGDDLGIERLWMAHTDRHLFLRLEVGRAVNLQEDNDLTLYLDTDDTPETGTTAAGIGAEVSWSFGERTGTAGGADIAHEDLGFHSLPTVESDVFDSGFTRFRPWSRTSSSWRSTGRPVPRGSGSFPGIVCELPSPATATSSPTRTEASATC